MQIGAADLPRRPLADKLLRSECNGTSAQNGYLLIFKVYTMKRMKINYKTVKPINVRSRLLSQNKNK